VAAEGDTIAQASMFRGTHTGSLTNPGSTRVPGPGAQVSAAFVMMRVSVPSGRPFYSHGMLAGRSRPTDPHPALLVHERHRPATTRPGGAQPMVSTASSYRSTFPPVGEMAYQVPSTPSPFASPGLRSPL
jgi:hypothetical protein